MEALQQERDQLQKDVKHLKDFMENAINTKSANGGASGVSAGRGGGGIGGTRYGMQGAGAAGVGGDMLSVPTQSPYEGATLAYGSDSNIDSASSASSSMFGSTGGSFINNTEETVR